MRSPYMNLTGYVKQSKKHLIPAVIHQDSTSRIQSVSRKDNPLFWNLIDEFKKITGIPIILNTSFNENEPIVCSIDDALQCFIRTDLDILAIGDFLIFKKQEDLKYYRRAPSEH